MKFHDVTLFLRLLGCSGIEVVGGGKWVQACCPLAPHTHARGIDENPSFGIAVEDEGWSSYHCFTCGSGSLADLVHKLQWTVGITRQARNVFLSGELAHVEVDPLAYEDSFEEVRKAEVPVEVPAQVEEWFPTLRGEDSREASRMGEWLEGRGIDMDVAARYTTRFNPSGRELIFPTKDTDFKTYWLQARSRMEKRFYHITPGFFGLHDRWGRRDSWYGIQYVDMFHPLILVESQTDVLRLVTLGFTNVMASCGSLPDEKLARVLSNNVVLGFDSDDAGVGYCVKALRYLSKAASLTRLSWNSIGRKDPGDLQSREELDEVWKNRRQVTMRGGEIRFIRTDEPHYNDRFAETN